MTDEEMAEKTVMSHSVKAIEEQIPYFEFAKQMFLAELKTGRSKWHKVADGDLPKENKLYLIAVKDNGLAIAYYNGLHWEMRYNLGDFGHCLEFVIAWCEIPKFEE